MPFGALFYSLNIWEVLAIFVNQNKQMVESLGYCCAVVIGLILGLMGGGGSILTVPVLVYIMAFNPVTATAYSLFIVGTTSAFGTFQNFRNGLVELKTGLLFAIPSLVGVYIARKFIVPAIPETIFTVGSFTLGKNMMLMLLFAIVIFIAALSMLKKNAPETETIAQRNKTMMVIQTFLAGILVGLVGAGGGFLFIPILVYVAKLPMKKAVATSLLIIAINSLVGFTGDIGNIAIDWMFLFVFTALAVIGIFIGIYFNKFVDEKQLKKGFGWFVLLMAVFILGKEILF